MPGKGRPPQAIPSPISRHIITCYVRYQGSKHTVIYILVQTIMSVQAKLEVVRRKHIVHLTGFGAYSSTWLLLEGGDKFNTSFDKKGRGQNHLREVNK